MAATRRPCRKLAASHTRSCNPSFTYSHSENETLQVAESGGEGHLSGQTIQQPKKPKGGIHARLHRRLSGYPRSVLLLFEIQYRVQHAAAYSKTLLPQRLYIEYENLDKRPQCSSSAKTSSIQACRSQFSFAPFATRRKTAFAFDMAINQDPSSQQLAIVATCVVSPIISCLFVTIRLWTRIFVTHTIGWDDCMSTRLSISCGLDPI